MLRLRAFLVNGLLLLSLVATFPADAATWTGFRGAKGNGVSGETGLPVEWSTDKNLAWKIDLPGRGNSSPAVTSDRVYLTSSLKDKALVVLSINRKDGRILWQKAVGKSGLRVEGPESLWAHRHNAATPSPVADEEHVWAKFGSGPIVCLDREGELVWQRNLQEEYGRFKMRFGMASSPRLWGDLLFVTCMHKGPSYVAALDTKTGEQRWKTMRRLPARDDGPDAYSSPVILNTPTRSELIVSGSDHVNAYDPRSGKQLWISGGLTVDSEWGRVIASPAVSAEAIVVCSAHPPNAGNARAIAVRPGGTGDVTTTNRLWTFQKDSSDCPSPVCYKGHVYMIRDNGVASCLDLKTGAVRWRKRLGEGTFRPSTVAGDGKVYFLSKEGLCVVVEAGRMGKILARNTLPGTFFATPAISDGVIYMRGHRHLYAAGKAKQ